MAPSRAALFAAFALVPASVGLGAEPATVSADAGSMRTVRAGPAADDPDRDDAGVFIWDRWGECAVVPRFSRDVVSHGPPTGDPEKDSLGFAVAGHDGCAGGEAR